MNTLILNGSPHPEGETMLLVRALTDRLRGKSHLIHCYTAHIAPCTDCRACRVQDSCVLADDMQAVYALYEQCDNLILASPVYYASLTGRLLDAVSRFQRYDAARRFRHAAIPVKPKRAAVILTCGGSGGAGTAFTAAEIILKELGATEIFPLICSAHTDTVPAADDSAALHLVREAAAWFNQASE